MKATVYTISSNQGRTVRRIAGQRNAETYIRTLISKGVSYSVETN